MITILAIIFCWFLFVEVIKGTVNRSRRKKEQRLAEARRREAARLQALRDADQERVRQAVLRHDLEIVQLRKEDEKQKAAIRKLNEQVSKLNQRMEQAEEDILQFENQRGQLIDYQIYLERERDACIKGSSNWHKWNNKCMTNNNKVYALDTRIRKAYYTKEEAQRKLEEVAS